MCDPKERFLVALAFNQFEDAKQEKKEALDFLNN